MATFSAVGKRDLWTDGLPFLWSSLLKVLAMEEKAFSEPETFLEHTTGSALSFRTATFTVELN